MYFVAKPNTDAFNFLDAAGITRTDNNSAIIKGIADLTTDLRQYGLWDKMKAIYPFVGQAGVSSSFQYNLKDPNTFRGTFVGGWTFASTGVTGDGTSAYMNTNFDNTTGTLNSAHLSVYLRTNINLGKAMIGGNDSNGRHYLGQGNSFATINSAAEGNYNPSSYQGFHTIKRETSTETKQFYNGSLNTTSTIISTGKVNVNFYVAARNTNGSPANYNNNQFAFVSIGDGLTDTQVANFYTAVQRFQTTLGRQV